MWWKFSRLVSNQRNLQKQTNKQTNQYDLVIWFFSPLVAVWGVGEEIEMLHLPMPLGCCSWDLTGKGIESHLSCFEVLINEIFGRLTHCFVEETNPSLTCWLSTLPETKKRLNVGLYHPWQGVKGMSLLQCWCCPCLSKENTLAYGPSDSLPCFNVMRHHFRICQHWTGSPSADSSWSFHHRQRDVSILVFFCRQCCRRIRKKTKQRPFYCSDGCMEEKKDVEFVETSWRPSVMDCKVRWFGPKMLNLKTYFVYICIIIDITYTNPLFRKYNYIFKPSHVFRVFLFETRQGCFAPRLFRKVVGKLNDGRGWSGVWMCTTWDFPRGLIQNMEISKRWQQNFLEALITGWDELVANSASKRFRWAKVCKACPSRAGKTDLEESVSILAVAMDMHRCDSGYFW